MRAVRIAFIAFVIPLLAACGGGAKPTVTGTIVSTGTILLPGTVEPSPDATLVSAATQVHDGVTPVSTAGTTIVGPPSGATPTPLAINRSPVLAQTATRTAASTPGATTRSTPQTPATATATPVPVTSARATDIPVSAPQQVIGTQQDGLVLLNVRTGNHDGYTRLVFDLTKQDGSAAPVPRTRVWTQSGTVIVALSGVRNDEYGQSLGSAEMPVNLGSVHALYRIPLRDDAAIAYGISIKPGATVTVSSATAPARVIVDITDK